MGPGGPMQSSAIYCAHPGWVGQWSLQGWKEERERTTPFGLGSTPGMGYYRPRHVGGKCRRRFIIMIMMVSSR